MISVSQCRVEVCVRLSCFRRIQWERNRWAVRLVLISLVTVLGPGLGMAIDTDTSPNTNAAAVGPVGALAHDRRWLTDATGRVVVLHGVNFVQKFPAIPPGEAGFDAATAAVLRAHGFNVVRLGALFSAIMPLPGRIDWHYVTSLAETIRVLGKNGIYVLVDFHQDGYGSLMGGDGFPEWATLTDGLPNPPVPFPIWYLFNSALQRAFDNFWDNRRGPDTFPLQEHYAMAVHAVAEAVAAEPHVLGYDLMNEPWPGAIYQSCFTGCPEVEQKRLVPFGERMVAAIRSVDAKHVIFSEPFVLFSYGFTDTSLSGIGAPESGLSFHVYAPNPHLNEEVMNRAVAAAERGDAIVATLTMSGRFDS
jgi:endoglycosylceramidase